MQQARVVGKTLEAIVNHLLLEWIHKDKRWLRMTFKPTRSLDKISQILIVYSFKTKTLIRLILIIHAIWICKSKILCCLKFQNLLNPLRKSKGDPVRFSRTNYRLQLQLVHSLTFRIKARISFNHEMENKWPLMMKNYLIDQMFHLTIKCKQSTQTQTKSLQQGMQGLSKINVMSKIDGMPVDMEITTS